MPTLIAAHHGGTRGTPRVIVMHTAEDSQIEGAAKAIAEFFHNQPKDDPNPTSVHGCIDDKEVWVTLPDNVVAYAAGTHANAIGKHYEQAGRARETARDWQSVYSVAELNLVAKCVAADCKRYGIPAVKIGPADLLAGKKGICGHHDFTLAYPNDTTHTDPGDAYPWDTLIHLVNEILNPTPVPIPEDDEMTKAIVTYHKVGYVNADWTMEIVDGVAVLRWVQSPAARNALVLLGVPRRVETAAVLDTWPTVGTLPPKG